MQDTSVVEKFQSAYKSHHSTETALLRVFNDILFSIDQGGREILVLLDLSSVLMQLIMPYYLIIGRTPLEYQAQHYLY